MGRRRRSRSRGGLSRRRFLAGGLLSLGGASLLGGTQAFSQIDATRAASVQTADDEDALLGLDVTTSVTAGDQGQRLVDVTNNAGESLEIAISLLNDGQGTVDTPATSISQGDTRSISVSVNESSPTGAEALPFEISADGEKSIGISLTRAVAVKPPAPALKRSVRDLLTNGASYEVSFEVLHLDSFDRIEVTFENQTSNWATETRTVSAREGTMSYSKDGTTGDQYLITMEVFDTDDSVVLAESIPDEADGRNPSGNDDLGSPDDPELDSFTLTDTSQWNPDIEIDYEVSNLDSFERVEVDIVNRNSSWATETLTDESPSGSVTYDRKGTMGDEIDVTVRAVNHNDTTTASGFLSHVVGSGGTKNWPE